MGGEGNGNPLQYSCLENPMDGGAWWAAVHGVAKSQTRLSDFTFTFHFHALEKEMATHSSVLAWRIPGTEEPGGLPSMGSHRVGHDWSDLSVMICQTVFRLMRYSLTILMRNPTVFLETPLRILSLFLAVIGLEWDFSTHLVLLLFVCAFWLTFYLTLLDHLITCTLEVRY